MNRHRSMFGEVLTSLLLVAALGGCASFEQAHRDEQRSAHAVASRSCEMQGWSQGTSDFAKCVRAEEVAQAARWRPITDALPPPTRIEPEAGQLCVPTASGLNLTC